MRKYKLTTKQELIEHCERTVKRESIVLEIAVESGVSFHIKTLQEHEIFLRLLKGESVDDIFEEE